MPETCTIANKTKGILVLNLPHGDVPDHASMASVGSRSYIVKKDNTTMVRGEKHRHIDIERQLNVTKRPISGSLTFLAGEKKEVSRTVLAAPEVKAALAANRIALIEPVAPVVKAAPAPTPAPSSQPTKGAKE